MNEYFLLKNLLASTISISTSVAIFNPLDCLRIKWQTNNNKMTLINLTKKIIKQKTFYSMGIYSNILGCSISRGIGIGFYPLLLEQFKEKNNISMFISGLISGSIGYGLSNPFWIIKTRQQSNNYYDSIKTGLIDLYKKKSLFQGLPLLVIRGGLMNAGNTLGYDGTKTYLKKKYNIEENINLHLLASFNAAILSTSFSVPIDYALNCFLTQNKIKFSFRGWIPMFVRVLPIYCLYLPIYEKLRLFFGLKYL